MDDTSTNPLSSPALVAIQASLNEKFPRLRDELAKYPLLHSKPLSYGTAGFRTHASVLESPLHRLGMLATLRSRCLNQITGVMVTASHNLGQDNGVKLVDGSGQVLSDATWVRAAEQLVNAQGDVDNVLAELAHVISTCCCSTDDLDLLHSSSAGNVFVARDTRASSESLASAVREGALVLGGNVLDFALQTTPQLHHYVRMWNHVGVTLSLRHHNHKDWASESGYYAMLSDGYQRLVSSSMSTSDLYIDAAHGVGAAQVEKLAHVVCATAATTTTATAEATTGHVEHSTRTSALLLGTKDPPPCQWHIRNSPAEGELNLDCGAEYCQKARHYPAGFSPEVDVLRRCCSLDGDADRLVYHYFDTQGQWHLLDGDKIAAFIATFFREHVLTLKGLSDEFTLTFGVVQTAYANGASTKYIRALGLEPAVAKTGVKFCHPLAAASYDMGLYMEANGHGTVLFQDVAVEQLQKIESSCTSADAAKKKACVELLAAYQIMNQSVGDAMSLILMIEALLRLRGWSIHQWDGIYTDLPSRQTKLAVNDRQVIQCNANETQVLFPAALQEEINALVHQIDATSGRAFVRPSGTEDVVRIYAEASSVALADALALGVAKAVYHLAGGVGPDEPLAFVA